MSNDDTKPTITDEAEGYETPVASPPAAQRSEPPTILSPEYMTKVGGIPGLLTQYKKPIIIMLIVIGLLVGTLLAVNALSNGQQTPAVPTPTPTLTVTPTPMRHMAPAATTSAFLKFETSLATLSGTLQAIQITDSTLTPPTVELPLGFSNQ